MSKIRRLVVGGLVMLASLAANIIAAWYAPGIYAVALALAIWIMHGHAARERAAREREEKLQRLHDEQVAWNRSGHQGAFPNDAEAQHATGTQ